MNIASEPFVLICGAGPAGLTLAVDLTRRGVPCRLVDRRPGPFKGSRGKGIQPRTLEVFEDLGIVDRILAAGGSYPAQLIHDPAGDRRDAGIHVEAPTAAEPFGQPWMVMQSTTESILRDRLGELGGEVEWATEVIGVTQGDVVHTTLRTAAGAETVTSAFVAAADGGRSTVRRLLDIGFPGKTLGVRAVVADLYLTGLDRTYWHRYNDGDMTRQIALCPLQGTDLFQLQAPVPFEGTVETTPDALARLIAARTGNADIRIDRAEWTSVYEMNARLADRYQSGRVFLVGDAAHTHPPTGGQGLNTSIQDAYNLGWKLGAVWHGAPVGLLATYEEERRPIAEGMLGLSTRLLDAAKRGQMRRGRDAQQLDLTYAGSSLCREVPERPDGLQAGDRAPDARFRTADGRTVRLFELMQGPHWTLLRYGAGAPSIDDRPALRTWQIGDDAGLADLGESFRTAYSARPGESFLLRPDGYVGGIFGPGHHDQAATSMDRYG